MKEKHLLDEVYDGLIALSHSCQTIVETIVRIRDVIDKERMLKAGPLLPIEVEEHLKDKRFKYDYEVEPNIQPDEMVYTVGPHNDELDTNEAEK